MPDAILNQTPPCILDAARRFLAPLFDAVTVAFTVEDLGKVLRRYADDIAAPTRIETEIQDEPETTLVMRLYVPKGVLTARIPLFVRKAA